MAEGIFKVLLQQNCPTYKNYRYYNTSKTLFMPNID